ncbi:MAG TPA: PD-(D/E)XK nuclease family protein [Casimicrobiaceae bacterium]|nr:PD-(D/E)XK nuclease family protein [Casimicrobiaceae bacterium]
MPRREACSNAGWAIRSPNEAPSFGYHDGVTSAVFTALTEGAVAITANRRLARHLHDKFDAAQRAAGRHSWPTPSILPYATWLATLWQRITAAGTGVSSAALLSSAQTAWLWRRVIGAASSGLLNPEGAAMLASEAWAIVHAWGAGGKSWRGWRRADSSDDASLFASWAEAYRSELDRAHAIDSAQLTDALIAHAGALEEADRMRVLFAGFIELTPQQQRLIDALKAAGADIRVIDSGMKSPTSASRTTAATPRDEVLSALAWARGEALADPSCRIGVVIEDLAHRRDQIVALAEDILSPGLIAPAAATGRRPFEISLGTPLASIPLVVAALDLIAIADIGLKRSDAASLLRSPYLVDAESTWQQRAAIERGWLVEGLREVTLTDAIAAMRKRCPDLADRWRRARPLALPVHAASPREWVDEWRAWLTGAGWPGSRPLDSAEHQARQAWEELLLQFAQLGAVVPRLERNAAIEMLHSLARERIFQAEGNPTPILLLGVLEASGLDFDALWVAGLSADRWPAAPAPNPLLPVDWQRARNVPHSSAANELAFARKLTLDFAGAALRVIFSSATSADDHPLLPSALLLDYPQLPAQTCPKSWAQMIAEGSELQIVADDRAPAIAGGTRAPGGSRIIAAQSDCPFQAVARHRLHIDKWPTAPAGLSREERGKLAHIAMAQLWTGLRDHASLVALDRDSVDVRIDSAVHAALTQLAQARRRNLPGAIWMAETRRLFAVLQAWIAIESGRPPFVVARVEAPATVTLASLSFSLRLDRVDALDDGGVAIVDYKTGRAARPSQWFDQRPQAPQLGMYMLAQRVGEPDVPVRALAYAQLRAEAIEAIGLTADASAWPKLTALEALGKFDDWQSLEAWWGERLGALASEVSAGCASVAPRERPSPCRACGLYALCRIESVRLVERDANVDE